MRAEMARPRAFIARVRRWVRRRSIVRVAGWVVATIIALQAIIIAILSVVVGSARKRRRPLRGFPHLNLEEIRLGNNELKVYSFGRDLYDAMLTAIDEAKESIYLETFIWKGDRVGEQFKEHLIRKAREGVDVYVIFDSFGNFVVPRPFKAFPPEVHALKYQAIQRVYHALDPRRYQVDHRKMLIVDGKVSFIGGYNLGSLYATQWRDTHLRICGPAAADLAQSFVDFWNRNTPKFQHIKRHYPRVFDPTIQLLGTDAMRLTFPIRDMYIEAIDRAEHHIYLTNAYFVPDHTLLDALQQAAGRGVDVQILLPWTSNHIVADWAARGYFTACLGAGIRIFGYRRAMVHAKTCTIDGQWSTIGTANLDRLSAVGNYEVNVEVYSAELAHQMEELFAVDKTNATEITLEHWSHRPWYVKLSEFILAPLRIAM